VVRSLKSRLEALTIDAEDIFREAKRQEKEMVFDDEEAEKLEARLSVIFKLKEKYGKTYEQIRAFDEKARSRLAYLNTLQTDLSGLEARKGLIRNEIERLAEALSRARKKGALPIEKAIMEELAFLSMNGARFHIRITDKGTVDETGRDDLEFLLSTNPGEPLRPLRRVASGGELSRIMLAIKKVVGGEEGKTLIFDEVDAGIGGRVAELVGRRLRELSEGHQIICITHLPQIAVYGHYQFLVEKFQEKNRTVTRIRQLKTVERVREVARMLGGINITEKTLQRAEEMVRHVAETKN
jgi:DNA repair protein RecN (Recombination protein N)